ncbi:DUF2293 domain-containing protein [uncultured Draconibacterium sp.]|uniref:DUF2293 domain-containing protein n=1 Tax=uncultured Draconibacterium sp. TaxID=1573823 RepID=UPI00321695C4
MKNDKHIVIPDRDGNLIAENGAYFVPPKHWAFLPAGDAGVTRKVTARGQYMRVQVKKGRRFISKGIWAPAQTIAEAKKEMDTTRSTDEYKVKLNKDRERRALKQLDYENDFCREVERFLRFHNKYKEQQKQMARLVTTHAIPVGSGTVARTQMIPIEERAAKAVIAWMRHKTTAYDNLKIARIKGERRAVRKNLAAQSNRILQQYRIGESIQENCPLQNALKIT